MNKVSATPTKTRKGNRRRPKFLLYRFHFSTCVSTAGVTGPISKSLFVLVVVYHTNLHTVLDLICIEVREACIDGYDGDCVYTLGAFCLVI